MHVVVTLETVLHVGKRFYLYEFTELNFCLPQLVPRTLNILIE